MPDVIFRVEETFIVKKKSSLHWSWLGSSILVVDFEIGSVFICSWIIKDVATRLSCFQGSYSIHEGPPTSTSSSNTTMQEKLLDTKLVCLFVPDTAWNTARSALKTRGWNFTHILFAIPSFPIPSSEKWSQQGLFSVSTGNENIYLLKEALELVCLTLKSYACLSVISLSPLSTSCQYLSVCLSISLSV